jgi:MFS transporter, PPP family, 3-phenylpropionic acid transporter
VSRVLHWQLAGFYFFYFAYIGAFAPYFSLYLQALDYSAALIGVVLAVPPATRIFAPYLWGHLADRRGRRVAIVWQTGLVGTLAYLGVFVSGTPAWLLVCMGLWCFFWSAALPLMEATTLDHLGGRSGDYGRIRLWGSVGFIAAVVGVGWILDRVEITVLLWIVGAMLIGILACAWRVPEVGYDPAGGNDSGIARVLRRPEVIALIAASMLMALAHGPYYTFFSIHLVGQGYSKTAVGWLWAIGVIAEIAVFAALPWLYRAFSAQTLLVTAFALTALRFLLIAWASHITVLLLIAQVLHAASFGVFHSAALVTIHRLFAGGSRARGQAVYSSLSFGLGGTLGGLGSGLAWERLGAAATFSAAAGCALLGLILIAVAPARK